MEMHEIYLVSSIHISLPIPLNEVNREWAKGTDDERSGSGMGCESKRHGEPRDRRHERDTKWRDEWRVARLSSFMFSSLSLFLSFRPAGLTSGASEVTRRTKRDEKPSERHEWERRGWRGKVNKENRTEPRQTGRMEREPKRGETDR